MGQQAPSQGEVSPDGQFVWDGRQWNPITAFRWEPTETTRRMQLVVGGYLLVAGLLTVLLSFFAESYVRQATARSIRDQSPALTAEQVKSILDFALLLGVAIAVLVGLILVTFGIMTLLRRWDWLFYADLVVLGLGGRGVFTGIFGLARGGAGPVGLAIPNLVLSAGELALFLWLLVSRLQGSIWGARRVPNL
ncbi:MAG TPA: hypothetical protein VLQ79_12555 [Myxococcaceae bacterium]|nr:hypothetical protein [Myxococcaceae bacterium]